MLMLLNFFKSCTLAVAFYILVTFSFSPIVIGLCNGVNIFISKVSMTRSFIYPMSEASMNNTLLWLAFSFLDTKYKRESCCKIIALVSKIHSTKSSSTKLLLSPSPEVLELREPLAKQSIIHLELSDKHMHHPSIVGVSIWWYSIFPTGIIL